MEWTWPISGKVFSLSVPPPFSADLLLVRGMSVELETLFENLFVIWIHDGRRRGKVSANNSLLVTENYYSTFPLWKITRDELFCRRRSHLTKKMRLWCPVIFIVTIPIWLERYSNLLFRETGSRRPKLFHAHPNRSGPTFIFSPKTHTNPKLCVVSS